MKRLIIYKHFFSKDREFFLRLREVLGFFPYNLSYYRLACVHRSAPMQIAGHLCRNNDRLEYLGDAVLDLVVSDILMNTYPDKNEGYLTQLRAKMVNGKQLASYANRLGITDMLVSRSVQEAELSHLQGDMVEALIGAAYLDRGYALAKRFVEKKIIRKCLDVDTVVQQEQDFKSRVLERCQKKALAVNFHTFEDHSTDDSKIKFCCFLRVEGQALGFGQAKSKKEAEQMAAEEALTKMAI